MAKITIQALKYARGRFSLEIDSLTIHSGEKVALMGENGCGKSTLLALITGLSKPKQGLVSYDSTPLNQIPFSQRARLFSLLTQFSDIAFPFTVFEVVLLGRHADKPDGKFDEKDHQLTMALLELLDIAHYAERSYADLSGGEKRRVMLGRVLNQQTPIIYLDEPNSSLDVRHTLEIFSHLYAMPHTVVASVHDINLALRHFDRFVFLKQGKLLFDVPRNEVSKQLLAEVYDVSVTTDPDNFNFTL